MVTKIPRLNEIPEYSNTYWFWTEYRIIYNNNIDEPIIGSEYWWAASEIYFSKGLKQGIYIGNEFRIIPITNNPAIEDGPIINWIGFEEAILNRTVLEDMLKLKGIEIIDKQSHYKKLYKKAVEQSFALMIEDI